MARRCLTELKTGGMVDQTLEMQRLQIESLDTEVHVLKEQIAADEQLLNDWQTKAQAQQILLDATRRDLQAWYHNPVIMASSGFLLGIAATTAIVLAVSHH